MALFESIYDERGRKPFRQDWKPDTLQEACHFARNFTRYLSECFALGGEYAVKDFIRESFGIDTQEQLEETQDRVKYWSERAAKAEQELRDLKWSLLTPEEQFTKLCEVADWTYQYSDDIRAWRHGNEQMKELEARLKMNPEFQHIYEKYSRPNG